MEGREGKDESDNEKEGRKREEATGRCRKLRKNKVIQD